MSRFIHAVSRLLVLALVLGPTSANANPVVGIVAGVAVLYGVLGATGEQQYDSQHHRIPFALAQVDEEMSRLESDCRAVQDARSHSALYDRLDLLRADLESDPANAQLVARLDRLRALPGGEEAYYVALMEKSYDYVGYAFPGNRYYVKRAQVQAINPCHLPALASLDDASPAGSGANVQSLMH